MKRKTIVKLAACLLSAAVVFTMIPTATVPVFAKTNTAGSAATNGNAKKTAKINISKVTISVGGKRTLKITPDQNVVWRSSNSKVVKVDQKGNIVAWKGGKATISGITAKKTFKCKVTVKHWMISSIAKNNQKKYEKQAKKILKETNKLRKAVGAKNLKMDKKLSEIAAQRSYEIMNTNAFYHQRPDKSSPWELLTKNGITWYKAAENIAYVWSDEVVTKEPVEMWYDSPSHRKSMLSKEYTKIGIGIAFDKENGRVFYTQIFTN